MLGIPQPWESDLFWCCHDNNTIEGCTWTGGHNALNEESTCRSDQFKWPGQMSRLPLPSSILSLGCVFFRLISIEHFVLFRRSCSCTWPAHRFHVACFEVWMWMKCGYCTKHIQPSLYVVRERPKLPRFSSYKQNQSTTVDKTRHLVVRHHHCMFSSDGSQWGRLCFRMFYIGSCSILIFFSFPCWCVSLLFTSVFIKFVLACSFTSDLQKQFSHDVDCLLSS